ncbi:CRE-SRH-240 protein [Caenorhabditis remanei]|uniref:CRE-SRH-240 protein n=1 Tax=Caenorhabditis remanei TaxID=31234 RepID=E3LI13_CAERE|nr:CRE-SRH-240 protein [Caenorhabditis remanei]
MTNSCIPVTGYFHSSNFLSFALHANTTISTPMHLFGFYCIIRKTPDQMKSAKWYLLNLHIWIVAFDYSFSILTAPFLLIPRFVGFPLGVLRHFGVPIIVQVVMVCVFLSNMLVSIAVLFESRFYSICNFPGKQYWARYRRIWMLLFYLAGCLSFISFTFLVPDQEVAKKNMSMRLPCLPDYIYQADNFVLTENITYHLSIFVIFFITFGVKTLSFVLGLFWNAVRQLKDRTMSQKTFHLHKTFVIALVIQGSVPLFTFAFPVVYAFIAVLLDYYNQAFINIAVAVLSMHGFLSSLVMICVHYPYRKSFLDLLRVNSKKISKRWFRYQRNAVAVIENS